MAHRLGVLVQVSERRYKVPVATIGVLRERGLERLRAGIETEEAAG
jgi:hypothetical protein